MLNCKLNVANLALDFMNPETRRISGVYRNFSPSEHRTLLERLLNLYVMWCGEFCILPPGVLLECAIADAAMRSKILFLRERLIRVPMGDMNLDHFLAERRYEYRSYKTYFPDLFQNRETALVEAPEAIVAKLHRTGQSIAGAWESLPERLETSTLPKWASLDGFNDIVRIAKVPDNMIRRGETLTWPDLRRELRTIMSPPNPIESRRWLQHIYLETYNSSFSLKTIRNLPAQLPDLGYLHGSLSYDYDAIKAVFDLWGLFRRVAAFPADQIIRLRSGPGFVRFRVTFEKVASNLALITELKERFALASTRVLANTRHGFSRQLFRTGNYAQIGDELDGFFNEIAEAVENIDNDHFGGRGGSMSEKFKDIRIAVIVALAEEHKLFCKYFDGSIVEKFHVGDLTIDILERDGAAERIGLVCINQMGNVAAAIAATRVLEVFDLDVVVNIGLAAGVDKNKQNLGDIIVADKIRYYETGKMKPGTFEFAPEYSNVNSAIVRALQTASWADWPLGASIAGMPRQVFFGTVASGEKVIANAEFVRGLINQDRKTIGIEMESYGIAAAVFGRKEKFLLIRGIADFADGSKNDSARLTAMEGSIRFFNEALYRGLLLTSVQSVTHIVPPPARDYTLRLKKTEIREGVANNYIEVNRTRISDNFKHRMSIIKKLSDKYTLGELRNFCIALQIDFDEIRGETKSEKAASVLDYVERKKLLKSEEFEALIDEE